jgi:cysteinyl-tRNA synthetase
MRNISAAGDGAEIAGIVAAAREAFANAMADDLNISEALAAMFDLQRNANRLADSGDLTAAGAEQVLAVYRDFDRIIACLEVDVIREQPSAPAEIVALAEERAEARKNKNFAESDRLRDEIAKRGFQIKDIPGGKYELSALK